VTVDGKVVFDEAGGEIMVCDASVVVVLSAPSGGIVVITVDVGLVGLVVWALLVHPATTSVMATAAPTASLGTVRIMAPTVIAEVGEADVPAPRQPR